MTYTLLPEILEHIFFLAYEHVLDEPSKADYRAIAGLSRLCSAWLIPAQRILFRTVTIRSSEEAIAFRNVLVKAKYGDDKGLAHVVRSIWTLRLTSSAVLSPNRLAVIIGLCPALQILRLDFHDLPSLRISGKPRDLREYDTQTLAFMARTSTVRALHFSGSLRTAIDLIKAWPSLEHVYIKAAVDPSITLTEQLINRFYEFRWEGVGEDQGHSLWKQLLGNSHQSLHILQLNHLPPPLEFDELLQSVPNLRSLRLPDCSPIHGAALQHCAMLQELMISQPPRYLALWNVRHKLQHLAFTFDTAMPQEDLDLLTQFICKSPGVENVSIHRGDSPVTWGGELRRSCLERGIGIRMSSHLTKVNPFWEVSYLVYFPPLSEVLV
ncbi:hypothetical protein SISNIDRAFT_488445 [Sistotremastrum niveocremeum HHB9708]|uniref:F-box domain-containing protein n=1 Tax=Sistotremastrum niveocremeum HHB9708 TaxID=1314777 RepID=A0A164R484_9AGAM|nr:hypothetical protein SISNIDRAFT_488445 [Sistotremastrum niveocremeum HHB9708]